MKTIAIILFLSSINIFAESEVISNKYITKSIVSSLVNDINTRTKYNISSSDNMWRYKILEEMRQDKVTTTNKIDFQIPLIWYNERF